MFVLQSFSVSVDYRLDLSADCSKCSFVSWKKVDPICNLLHCISFSKLLFADSKKKDEVTETSCSNLTFVGFALLCFFRCFSRWIKTKYQILNLFVYFFSCCHISKREETRLAFLFSICNNKKINKETLFLVTGSYNKKNIITIFF